MNNVQIARHFKLEIGDRVLRLEQDQPGKDYFSVWLDQDYLFEGQLSEIELIVEGLTQLVAVGKEQNGIS